MEFIVYSLKFIDDYLARLSKRVNNLPVEHIIYKQ